MQWLRGTRVGSSAPAGATDFSEIYLSALTRANFTTLRTQTNPIADDQKQDFLCLLTLASEIYPSYAGELVVMQSFHNGAERFENTGINCIVSRRAIEVSTPSNITRGGSKSAKENIIVKRVYRGVSETDSPGLRSFIKELRVRSHPPLRNHPNIVNLRGIGWDFEDEARERPRPLLLEEYASFGSLSHFWSSKKLTQMPFNVKATLCLNIANGLSALHECGIVHGDIKPENILIFSQPDKEDGFMAKLTDFGHSVFSFEGLESLPAFTAAYCAPEVNTNRKFSFDDMKQTDIYSYGLVILSLVLGRNCCRDFGDRLAEYKENDALLEESMKIVEKEDREQKDSDLDLATLQLVFTSSMQLDPKKRSLRRCKMIFTRQLVLQRYFDVPNSTQEATLTKIEPLTVHLSIGYQTLSQCSFLLKERAFKDLQILATDSEDERRGPACWELCVCYFSGFGVETNYEEACKWLTEAALLNVPGAQAYFYRLHKAMGIRPFESLMGKKSCSEDEARSKVSSWIFDSVALGFQEVLSDLHMLDEDLYLDAKNIIAIETAKPRPVDEEDQVLLVGLFDGDIQEDPPRKSLAQEYLTAISFGNLSSLTTLFEKYPSSFNEQDKSGDTPLIWAARCGRYTALDVLLKQQGVRGDTCNWLQQNALHFLGAFADAEIEDLVPRLVSIGADVNQEAAFVGERWGDAPALAPRIRSCPLLRAVLGNNKCLLETLLKIIHVESSLGPKCSICQSGSRYRKILAVAVMLRRVDIINALLEHRRIWNVKDGDELNNAKVWYGQQFISLWQLAVRGPPVAVADLPERFCRALAYGESYRTALKDTLAIICPSSPGRASEDDQVTLQLQQAVLADNVEAIDWLLGDDRQREEASYKHCNRAEPWNAPLILSIRLGFREPFQKLYAMDRSVFRKLEETKCRFLPCKDCRWPFDYSIIGSLISFIFLFGAERRSTSHKVNIAQVSLSFAATAVHQDEYFLTTIMENADFRLLLKKPAEFDERLFHHPSSYLAQAILANSAWAFRLITRACPKSFHQKVCMLPNVFHYVPADAYTLESHKEILNLHQHRGLSSIPLTIYVLLIGSYSQCRLVLTYLQEHRQIKTIKNFKWVGCSVHRDHDVESQWEDLLLTNVEYHCLLTGLIRTQRKDRMQLWEVVRAQTRHGHSKSVHYLEQALFHANNKAVKKLLELGWNQNGSTVSFCSRPMDLALRLENKFSGRSGRSPPHWISDKDERSKYDKGLKKNVETLQRVGANKSWIHSKKALLTVSCSYVLVYLLILPLSLGYSLKHWYGSDPRFAGTNLLRDAYGYSAICLIFLPAPFALTTFFIWKEPFLSPKIWNVMRLATVGFWLVNNFCLPYVIFTAPHIRKHRDDVTYISAQQNISILWGVGSFGVVGVTAIFAAIWNCDFYDVI